MLRLLKLLFSHKIPIILLLTLSVYSIISRRLDPDFGWHLRTGQLILERGIPHTDWFSYTRSSFPWIAFEWLTDVFTALTFQRTSFFGLNLIYTIIISSTFILLIKNLHSHTLPFFLIAFLAVTPFLGIRPQLITFLFLTILWLDLSKFLEHPRLRYLIWLPPFFALWANLHAGFPIGLLVLTIVLLPKIINLSHLTPTTLSFLLVACFLATLLNPYGLHLYQEHLRTLLDPVGKANIIEWQPPFLVDFDLAYYLYATVFFSLLLKFRSQLKPTEKLLSLLFFLMSLTAVRHIPLFIAISLPLFDQLLAHLIKTAPPQRLHFLFSGSRLLAFFLISLSFFCLFLIQVSYTNWPSYPQGAVNYLKTHLKNQNMFNEYGWGGYLIWQLPDRQTFIDGRMTFWNQPKPHILTEYNQLKEGKTVADLINKYQLGFFLLNKSDQTLSVYHSVIFFFLNLINRAPDLTAKLPPQLLSLGFVPVYEDNLSVIYAKPQ